MAENCDESKKELEDSHENRSKDREPKCSHYPVKSAANRWVRKRGPVANETNAWPSWEMTISLPSMTEVFETSLTSSNSFSVHFADLTLLTLCCTIESRAVSHSIIYGCHVPHLLSVMRTCQFKGYWDAHARHTQRVCTPRSVTDCISTFPEVDQTWEA